VTPETRLRQVIAEADLPLGPHGGRQNLLADCLGINRGRFSQYVSGERRIALHHLFRIASALGVAPADILGYVPDER
jgi:transcriptional regulator with XRE-family HTH domain